jgi:hypothetical protein
MTYIDFEGSTDQLVFYSGTYAALFADVPLVSPEGKERTRRAKIEISPRHTYGSAKTTLLDQAEEFDFTVKWKRGNEWVRGSFTSDYAQGAEAAKELALVRLKEAISDDRHVARRAEVEHIKTRIAKRERDLIRYRDQITASEKANADDVETIFAIERSIGGGS